MAEPTKLPSAEEFNFMLSSVARDAAYAAALARVAELEAWQEVSLTMAEETHEVMDVVATQRDTALAELAVLRAALEQIARGPDDPRNYPARDTSIESHYEIVAIRALTALHEAEQERDAANASDEESTTLLFKVANERDAANARVAELEAFLPEFEEKLNRSHADAIERDALAAELVELRGRTIQHILDLVPHSPHCNGGRTFYLCGKCDVTERINKEFAAQPQGERGTAILAAVEVVRRHADMVSRACEEDSPIEYSDYENFAFELLRMFAAIDGAKP